MINLKKQFYTFRIVLFTCLGLFLIINKNHVIALENENIYNNKKMQINNIFLEKEEDLLYYIINKNFYQCFSSLTLEYPCYNGGNIQYDLTWMIKNPPVNLLCVLFDKEIRDRQDNLYSLEDLKQMGNGASNMYIFWLKKSLNLNPKVEKQKNIKDINQKIFYQLEIISQANEIEKILYQLNLFQEAKIKLENELENQKNIYFNAKNYIAKLEKIIKILEEINNVNKIKDLEIEEMKNQLHLLKIELKNEKEKYQQMENILKQQKIQLLNQQNNLEQLTQKLEEKINTCSGIFHSLYKKIFNFN